MNTLNNRKCFVLIISLLLIITFVLPSSNAFANEKTLGDVEAVFNEYMVEEHPGIIVGSKEYVDFLCEQLTLQTDKQLVERTDYEDIVIFASKYLYEMGNPLYIQENYVDDVINVRTTDYFKTKTISKAIDEAETHDKIDKKQVVSVNNTNNSTRASYSVSNAVAYAKEHAIDYNSPEFKTYSSDCTNFVSQCVYAGGKSMNVVSDYQNKGIYETTSYWYSKHWTSISPYHRYGISTSFIRVGEFYTYWKNHGATIIQCSSLSSLQNTAKLGDIVQVKNSSGEWYHSVIITAGSSGAWKYSAHSRDRIDYNVSKMTGVSAFRIIRF